MCCTAVCRRLCWRSWWDRERRRMSCLWFIVRSWAWLSWPFCVASWVNLLRRRRWTSAEDLLWPERRRLDLLLYCLWFYELILRRPLCFTTILLDLLCCFCSHFHGNNFYDFFFFLLLELTFCYYSFDWFEINDLC